MVVVQFLEALVEARAQEARVQLVEGGEDAREELLEREGVQVGWEEGVQRGRRGGVGRVEADADDGEVGVARVVRVHEDAADFDVGFRGGGFAWVEGVWVVRLC